MSDETSRNAGSRTIREYPPAARGHLGQDSAELYEFGLFRLEPSERKLWRNNEPVVLTPKAFDTLVLLVRNSGHLLEKDELIRKLWPDSFVEEGNLSNNIFVLRKALGEEPEYIETVPKKGYRFVGAVRQLPKARMARAEEVHEERVEPANDTAERRSLEQMLTVAPAQTKPSRAKWVLITVGLVIVLGIGGFAWRRSAPRPPSRSQWVQLTGLSDSASQPTLSPDGHMLAFVRGPSTWIGPGQVYVKMLPDGEPVQLTHDDLLKSDPAFSPDGSRIAYTVLDPQHFAWDTWVVPTLRGEPEPMMRNASGLTWTDRQRVLFSEIKSGVHMGIVAAEESRLGARDVYLPTDEPAMAHHSYLSPDGKWVLLVEMDQDHQWLPCRKVPVSGGSQGQRVGPLTGSCMSAAWSRDGKWMYFTANPTGVNHIWRQRFPDGQPAQVTFGPTEEEGVAMAPDGRSFVTAVALQNTSLWVHDAKGTRQIFLEGNGKNPKFTPDGKKLCYLVAKEATSKFAWFRNPGELWIADLESGRSESVLRGFDVHDYDVSPDGKQVVIGTTDQEGKRRLWVAQLDRSSSPTQIPNLEGVQPRFGPSGDIFFRHSHSAYRVRPDGSGLRTAFAESVYLLWGISPDERWIVGWAPLQNSGTMAMQAFSLEGKSPVAIGGSFAFLSWTLDGRTALLGGSYFVPLAAGQSLPQIPEGGFHSDAEIASLPGAHRVEEGDIVLGPSSDVYAFYRGTVQRNLYRIPVP
jgi:DNA-binding winged helix-turn-helix (wHTH) protein/Tol biopolymer transport system component